MNPLTITAYALVSKKSGNIVKDDPFLPLFIIFPTLLDANSFVLQDTKKQGRQRFDIEEITITRNNG